MMKFYVSLVGGSLVALGLVGCVELDQSPLGSEEQAWQSTIKQSYPSWQPPRMAPHAIKDNMSKDYVENAPAPAFDGTAAAPAAASEDINVNITETPAAVTETVEVGVPGNNEVVVKTDLAPADPVPADTLQAAADDAAKDQAKAGGKDVSADKTDAKTDKADKEIKYTEYTVVAGDSVSVIARKVYKDGRLYYPILKANEALKKNPNRLYPGMKLRIPQL